MTSDEWSAGYSLAPCPLLPKPRPLLPKPRSLLLFNELCLAVRAFLWQVVEELVVAEVVVAFFIGTYATLAELVGDAFALCRQLAGIDERLDGEEQRCEERQSVEYGRYGAEVAIAPEDETYGDGTHGEDTRAATHGIEHLLLFVDFGRFLLIFVEHLLQRFDVGNLRQQRFDGSPVEEVTFVSQFDAVVLRHDGTVHLHAIDKGDVLHLQVFEGERAVVVECEAEMLSAHRHVDTLLLAVADIFHGLPLLVHNHQMQP